MRTTTAQDRALILRQAQRLGCTGTHTDRSGVLRPCSSAAELERLLGNKPSQPRERVGGNRIRRQWENLGENGIVSIDTLNGGGLVSGVVVKSELTYQPRDNDPDVFTDIESARQRARQLGCIGVSRRISKSGKTVWMPCTNMSDFNRLTGSTPLGRRHQRESIRRIIRDEIRRVDAKKRKKSLVDELNADNSVNDVKIKELGRTIGSARTGGRIFQDITGVIDGDADGFVYDNDIKKRRPIIPIAVVGSDGNSTNLSPAQQGSAVRAVSQMTGSRSTIKQRRADVLARMKVGARISITDPDIYFSSRTSSEIINDVVPTSPQELMASISTNPYSKSNAENIFSTLMKANPNWEAAARLRQMMLQDFGNGSDQRGIRSLIKNYGSPVIVPTDKFPSRPLFGRKKWKNISGAYDPRGFIGINSDLVMGTGDETWVQMSRDRKMSVIRHELGHAFADMAMLFRPELMERRISLLANDVEQEMTRLTKASRAEKRLRKTYLDYLNASMWGTRDEFRSARQISEYATFSRDEYFAETIDALFDPKSSIGNNRIDSLAIKHAAETLGISISELLDLSGREREIPSLTDMIRSRSIPVSGSRSTVALSRSDQQIVDFVSANPQVIDEVPFQLLGRFSPDTLDKARYARAEGARVFDMDLNANRPTAGSGGRKLIDDMMEKIDGRFKNRDTPSVYSVIGPSGSGKTTAIQSGRILLPDATQSLHVGIDEIKKGLVGYNDGTGSARIHAAARFAQRKAADIAASEMLDVVLDDYGNNDMTLRSLRSNGYKSIGHMIYTNPRQLEERIREREKQTGPVLGAVFSRMTNENYVSNVKQQIRSGLYDGFNIWDNSRKDGIKKVASTDELGIFTVHDQALFNKIFGADSQEIRALLENSATLSVVPKKTPKTYVYRTFNDNGYTKFSGHTNENKLTRKIIGEVDTYRLDVSGQSLEDNIDLSSMNLSGSKFDMSKGMAANIGGANLFAASFQKAYMPVLNASIAINGAATDLRYANFEQANLSGSDFTSADMRGANLFMANLSGANLLNTNLMMANLDGADLRGANLQGAQVSAAQLSTAKIDVQTILPRPGFVKPKEKSLSGYKPQRLLPGLTEDGPDDAWKLSGLVIDGHLAASNGDFSNVSIPLRNMTRSLISNTSFRNSNMDESHFMESEIDNSSIKESSLIETNFSNSTFRSVAINDSMADGANFNNVTLDGVLDLSGTSLRTSNMKNIDNSKYLILNGVDLSNADLSGTDLSSSQTDGSTNLDGAVFSSKKHLPTTYSGMPTISAARRTDSDSVDLLSTTSVPSIIDYFNEVINNKRFNLKLRGLTVRDWISRLNELDYEKVDFNNRLSVWSRKNQQLMPEIEAMRKFILPDGSSIDLFEYTGFNSPDRLIAEITELAKKNSQMFSEANPDLLWRRAMAMRSYANYLDIDNNRLLDRQNTIQTLENARKIIDATLVNYDLVPQQDNDGAIEEVLIEDTDDGEVVPLGSRSSTENMRQHEQTIDELRLASTDLEQYILQYVANARVEWAPGHSQVPVVRLPRIPILSDAMGLTDEELSLIGRAAYPTREDRVNIARAVDELLRNNSTRVFGVKIFSQDEEVILPKMLDGRGLLNFDDDDSVNYRSVTFDNTNRPGTPFVAGNTLRSRDGQDILTFTSDFIPYPVEDEFSLFAKNYYGSELDQYEMIDMAGTVMTHWEEIITDSFLRSRPINSSILGNDSLIDASTSELISRGLIPDVDQYIEFADNEIGRWYREQIGKLTEAYARKINIIARAASAKRALRSAVGSIPTKQSLTKSNIREVILPNLASSFRLLYPNQAAGSTFIDDGLFLFMHLNFALSDGSSNLGGNFDSLANFPDFFLHEMGHLVLGLGADRHGDFAANYATFLALGGDSVAHSILNSYNTMQSEVVSRWSLGEPVDQTKRIPGNIVSDDEREILPQIRVPKWAELTDSTWGLPEGRVGSRSSTGPKPGRPENWDDLPDEIKRRFDLLLGSGEPEELIGELRDAVFENPDTGFSFIGHKFVHGLYFPGQERRYNRQLAQKQQMANDYKSNKKWDSFIFIHERPYRVEAFMEIEDQLTDDEYWSILADVWTDSENIPEMRDFWDELLSSPRANRLSMMRDDERVEYDSLSDVITVYQGHTEYRDDGWSWTTDPEVATFFANRFSSIESSPGYITTATVRKDDIHAFLTRRGENEVLVDPDAVSINSTHTVRDFIPGSKSQISPPHIFTTKELALLKAAFGEQMLMPRTASIKKLNRYLTPEQKAVTLRILKSIDVRPSEKHSHVPILSYGYIDSLAKKLGISRDDVQYLRSIEYISLEQRKKLKEFVDQKSREVEPFYDGWSYEIRAENGKPVISFMDKDGMLIFSMTNTGGLSTWGLIPDEDAIEKPEDETDWPDGETDWVEYQGMTLYLNRDSLAGVFRWPYEDNSFGIFLSKFMDKYNLYKFHGWNNGPEDWQENLESPDESPMGDLISGSIDDVFTFGDSPSAKMVRDRIALAKQAIDDSFSKMSEFINNFTSYANRRNMIVLDEGEIEQARSEVARDAILFDALVDKLEDMDIISIAQNIVPEIVDVIEADSIEGIGYHLNPAELPGGWEHELGHIIFGLGATRHGDFASNYLIWMIHGYSPAAWLISNYFNTMQGSQFSSVPGGPTGEQAVQLNIPLWMDVPPSMIGYPDNPRAVPPAGSKSSTAYSDALRGRTRITPTQYVDSMPKSGKAWLYPDGTLLPVGRHADLSIADMDGFWFSVMEEGLIRIDISYNFDGKNRPPHSIVVDIGTRQMTAAQINAIRTLLVTGNIPKMFFSVGGTDPTGNMKGTEYVFNTGIDNLGRFLPAALTGLREPPSPNVGKTNHPGSLKDWKPRP